MNTFLITMLKASVYMAGFYTVYWIFLSRDTMYGRNRAFILLSVMSSLILPLITIQTSRPFNIPLFGKVLSEIFISGGSGGKDVVKTAFLVLSVYKWAFIIYISGLIFFSIKLIVDLLELTFLIKKRRKDGFNLIKFHGLNTAGFSAFGYIFINSRLSEEEASEIIRHEQNHLDHHHSADIIIIEIIQALQWFNPFIHLFSRSLRAVHEFQADKKCIGLGITVNKYQKLLMNQVFKSKVFTISNSFSNPSLVKKRMIMMTRKESKSFANFKLLFILPVVATTMLVFSSCNTDPLSSKITENFLAPPPPPPPPVDNGKVFDKDQVSASNENQTSNDPEKSEPFVVVEQMPVFPGGETSLLKYIAENTTYPEIAKGKNIQGKVIVRFCVNESGDVERATVLKGVSPELDIEAIRVVQTLPKFKPGRQGGKEVPVWYMVPINFTLQ